MSRKRNAIRIATAGLPVALVLASAPGMTQTAPKPATVTTKAANRAVQQHLNFNDRGDFEDATRGLVAKPDTLTVRDAKGNVVWDLEQ